jgi:hypothetical protein
MFSMAALSLSSTESKFFMASSFLRFMLAMASARSSIRLHHSAEAMSIIPPSIGRSDYET